MLLLDLDGTISDPGLGIENSFNHALRHFGYEPLTKDQVDACIGPPLNESFAAITGSASPEHITELVAVYRDCYAATGYRENTLYAGIPEALAKLKNRNIQLAVCTSKRRDFALSILQMFALHHYFDFVSGGDVGIQKTQQIKELLDSGRINPDWIMVGDRHFDMHAAHANGLKAAGVLWGYGSQKELALCRPEFLLNTPEELTLLVQ
ncbi:MAG: HAD hydrolase-like protein [Desulfobulbaceae bacterium]|nr:HAD hydrolase-like protein [Desulfobulbaceae bacterium]